MKILILEDSPKKSNAVQQEILSIDQTIHIDVVSNFRDYHAKLLQEFYNLLVVDLMVLDFPKHGTVRDMTEQIIEVTRDFECLNYRTPVLALTQYDQKAEEKFKDLNQKDIAVLTFDEENGNWKASLRDKVKACIPPITYDFIIVCALEKEADAYREAGYEVGATQLHNGLFCRPITIENRSGAIVTAPRMGLVTAAVTCTQAIDFFKPKLICMSGICGGVNGRAKIYDVILPEICHQNDSGKWTDKGFVHEGYSVQLDHGLRQKLAEVISRSSFHSIIAQGISLKKSEIPETADELQFDVFLAPASSGSAVVAEHGALKEISGQHRKLSAFEMESFALYESARLSPLNPKYFSAKSVVDDGTPSKGDAYHRVAAILSAKVVYECIRQALIKDL